MKTISTECPEDKCGLVFMSDGELTRHIVLVHSQRKKFQCSICLKTLSSRQSLREHNFIHTGEKPFRCPEPGCGMDFRQGSQLSAHKRIHRAVNRFKNQTEGLKVKTIQLTDLLERQSSEPTFLQKQEVHPVAMEELPKITGPKMGSLPSLFSILKA